MKRVTVKRGGIWYFATLFKGKDGCEMKAINSHDSKYISYDGGFSR